MSEHRAADDVNSGGEYVVVSVDGRPPATLGDFVSEEVVLVTVESDRQVVEIRGSARRDGDSVVVYEKAGDGSGKDVRTWKVVPAAGRFLAATRSIY